jgi:hypothetical protein
MPGERSALAAPALARVGVVDLKIGELVATNAKKKVTLKAPFEKKGL